MSLDKLKKISIRGRVAFCIKAVENAFRQKNVTEEERIVFLDSMYAFLSSNSLDDWEVMISEITPSCLLNESSEFSSEYFDSHDLIKMRDFYRTLPNYLIDILEYTIEVGTENIYGSTGSHSELTLKPLLKVIDICNENQILLPNIDDFLQFRYSENKGWGNTFDKTKVP